jgi:transcriptional regulator with XRE-family HTH domain
MPETTLKSGPVQHRIVEVRRREGVSRRTMCRKLGIFAHEYRDLEASTDPRLSELLAVAAALEVPVAELLSDADQDENQRLRGLLSRVMKAVHTLKELLPAGQESGNIARYIESQLLDQMPELAETGALPRVGSMHVERWGRLAELPPVSLETHLDGHFMDTLAGS